MDTNATTPALTEKDDPVKTFLMTFRKSIWFEMQEEAALRIITIDAYLEVLHNATKRRGDELAESKETNEKLSALCLRQRKRLIELGEPTESWK